MTGQTAGLVLVAVGLAVAAVETFRGWREQRREQKREQYLLDRDGL